jgi:hypothetical protein
MKQYLLLIKDSENWSEDSIVIDAEDISSAKSQLTEIDVRRWGWYSIIKEVMLVEEYSIKKK